jgi:hypothetical protein
MPLVVLGFTDRQAHRFRLAGAEERRRLNDELWEPYLADGVDCFLCDAAIPGPVPHTAVVPDRKPGECVALPLCAECGALPYVVRVGRCTRLLRKMWGRTR